MPVLQWLTREQDLRAAGKAPYRLLNEEGRYGDPAASNMLIQGDNLDALKALLPYYAGKVKCIYIDPPYNTHSAFEHYDDNLEHTQWLSMMYPRLEILRKLLSDDGSMWINIDDDEGHYLKVLCDEILGRNNFINTVIWEKKYTIANDSKYLSDNHDFIFVYALNKEVWKPNRLMRTEDMNKSYKNPDNHPKGVWKSTPLHAKSGSESSYHFSYTFKNGVTFTPPSGTFSRYSAESLKRMDEGNEIWFGRDGNAIPSRKTFLCDLRKQGIPSKTIWRFDEVGHNHEAREEVKSFNSEHIFATPKPERLIQRILHIATNPGDLVLDSFLGSGTTAAVAHKMGRRYIGVEIGEHAVSHCIPRLQKVIEGEQGGISKAVNWQGGGGFRFYRLGEAVFAEDGSIRPDVTFAQLAAHVWFAETGVPLSRRPDSPLLGVHDGTACYLLYNGILGDRSAAGGNVLTGRVLGILPPHDGPKVVYGERSMFSPARLKALGITFKQTPYDIKGR